MAGEKSDLERICLEVHSKLEDQSIQFGFGMKDIDGKGIRRIVWTNLRGRIERPTTAGVRGQCSTYDQSTRVKAIYANLANVDAFIMSESFADLERMHGNLLSAAHDAYGSSLLPGDYEVISEQNDRYGHVLRNRAGLVQRFTFDLVVYKYQQPLTTLTPLLTHTHTCEIDPTLGDS